MDIGCITGYDTEIFIEPNIIVQQLIENMVLKADSWFSFKFSLMKMTNMQFFPQ